MPTLREKTKSEIEHLVGELTRLRDQMRLKLHLASMELRDRYEELDEEIFEAEQRAKRATEETAQEIKERLRELRTRMEGLRDRASTM
ncbi:MAG: hypothetical protein M5U28_15045 [Sandaracinaceae bacterium]|nr:hypothetical protein [Sandaracinaceae bacterium]